jgi:hypothetical protein
MMSLRVERAQGVDRLNIFLVLPVTEHDAFQY